MQKTGIEYLTHTWNPIAMRCVPCSLGCDNCWHLKAADRLCENPALPEDERAALAGTGPFILRERELRAAVRMKKPAVIGVQFMGDLFHENVPQGFTRQAYNVMLHASTPHGIWHTYLILTKRPHRMADFVGDGAIPGNIYCGLTVCNQQEWDEKKRYFYMIPGKKFLSLEPLLGAIDLELTKIIKEPFFGWPDSEMEYKRKIDAVILGGETGPGARPMHPDWVRSIRDQCATAGISFFFKGWGEWIQCDIHHEQCPGHKMNVLCRDGTNPEEGIAWNKIDGAVPIYRAGRSGAGRTLDGRTHDDLPWRTA